MFSEGPFPLKVNLNLKSLLLGCLRGMKLLRDLDTGNSWEKIIRLRGVRERFLRCREFTIQELSKPRILAFFWSTGPELEFIIVSKNTELLMKKMPLIKCIMKWVETTNVLLRESKLSELWKFPKINSSREILDVSSGSKTTSHFLSGIKIQEEPSPSTTPPSLLKSQPLTKQEPLSLIEFIDPIF